MRKKSFLFLIKRVGEAENYLECYSFSKKGEEEVIFERFFPFEIIIIIKLFIVEEREREERESFLFIFIFDDFEYYSFSKKR